MGRKVEDNHKVVAENESPATDLIQQQEEFTFEEEEPVEKESKEPVQPSEPEVKEASEPEVEDSQEIEPKEKEPEEKEPEMKKSENYLILTGAASYTGCGMRFFKNQPTLVTDDTACKKLLSTGLFVLN